MAKAKDESSEPKVTAFDDASASDVKEPGADDNEAATETATEADAPEAEADVLADNIVTRYSVSVIDEETGATTVTTFDELDDANLFAEQEGGSVAAVQQHVTTPAEG